MTPALLNIKPHAVTDLGVIRETAVLDSGIKELKPPEAPVTVAGAQRLQAVFWAPAIGIVRFDNNSVVDRAIFRRNAVVDSFGFTNAPRGRRHQGPPALLKQFLGHGCQ